MSAQSKFGPDLVQLLEQGVWITDRMVQNVREAQRFWMLRESLRARLETEARLQAAIKWQYPAGLDTVQWALLKAAVLAVLRVSDRPNRRSDSASACRLCGMLWNEELATALSSMAWVARRTGTGSPLLEAERFAQQARIAWFRANVPCGWDRGDQRPAEGRLAESRDALREFRNFVVAHSTLDPYHVPTGEEIADAISIARDVALSASLIFLGHTSGLMDGVETSTGAEDVWHYLQLGIVSAHQKASSMGSERALENL